MTYHKSAIIILVGLGFLATYTGIVIGQYRQKYPHIHSFADAGEVLLGPWGRELFGFAQVVFLIFIMASHILTFTVAMNTITKHVTCSVVWGVVGLVISFILSLPRTLEKMSWLSLVCMSPVLLNSSPETNSHCSVHQYPRSCHYYHDCCWSQ